ncbi:MAG: dihydroxy-acid dehydratase [Actinobacteria bacterium]|nr:dihydroxy-acid dehydratase [Actinomycetota bacterium]
MSERGLRSACWFQGDDVESFIRRSAMKVRGLRDEDFVDVPKIGVCTNWSELARCHLHFGALARWVKEGIQQAGGLAFEFPSMSLGADLAVPAGATFMHRNLLAVEVEQTLSIYPLDAVVLIASCDETIPAMLMGAASAGVPAIILPGGPGLGGRFRGEEVGSGTDAGRNYDRYRAGEISPAEWRELEEHIERSPGHCSTAGTASTLACVVEAMGLTEPGAAATPAVDSRRGEISRQTGRTAVALARQGVPVRDLLTDQAFENGVRMLAALAGSTNVVMHLLALARRAGSSLDLRTIDRISRETPAIVDVKPAGRALMEDLFFAGGVPAVLGVLAPLLNLDAPTVGGQTVAEVIAAAEPDHGREGIIHSLEDPLEKVGGIAAVFGNLAPDGAVIKRSVASPELLRHRGPAIVFESREEMLRRLEDDALEVTPESVLVLKHGGPVGGPGMPEWGNLPLPRKMLRAGVRDMLRVSDSRMSGTAAGTAVLHVSPEAAVGGPLAALRDGDMIELDVEGGRLEALLPEGEIARRLAARKTRGAGPARGYARLYAEHVTQAHDGCDFDFLAAAPR